MNSRVLMAGLILCAGMIACISWFLRANEQEVPLPISDPFTSQSPLQIIANQGQWNSRILYQANLHGGRILFEGNRVTYHLFHLPESHDHARHDPHHVKEEEINHHVFHMEFVGANPSPELIGDKQNQTYNNYFLGNDPSKWAGGVPLYGMLTYTDLYPGIDLRFYGVGDELKYEFVVHPGADPGRIQVVYPGLDQIRIDHQSLLLTTSLRTIRELPPVAYQKKSRGKHELIDCQFSLTDGILRYQLPEGFNAKYPLIIDPALVFSTYTGSVSSNWGFAATYDEEGNAYAAGIQRGASIGAGYPVTTGAYQTVFRGGISDAVISKFSADGSELIYSTFLGGPAGGSIFREYQDLPLSMRVNSKNELIVLGTTDSPSFPTTNGAYDESANGNYDIFVSKFSADATSLMASTLIGSSGDDGVNGFLDITFFDTTEYNYNDYTRAELLLDKEENIYLVTNTTSITFPMVGTPFQSSKGDEQDACIVKLNPGLTQILWSSYLGGSGEDAAYSAVLDPSGNLYVSGGTDSQDFPTSDGVNTSYLGGKTDGYIVKISKDGDSILAGTFIGTNAYDQAFYLDLDQQGNVYVLGQTEGNYSIVNPSAGAAYANNGAKQFISKLSSDLDAFVFSTVFGSENATHPNISPTAFKVDQCNNIYVSGWGGKTNQQGTTDGMPITSDAYQSNTDGSDFYLMLLSENAQSLLYGSFIGGTNGGGEAGDHVDAGSSRFDERGVLYQAVCAGCWGVSTFPATTGAYSTTNNATVAGSLGCNQVIIKFDFEIANIRADFNYSVAFDEVSFQNTSSPAGTYFWDFGDGQSSTATSPSHTYQDTGTYTVQLIADLGNDCAVDTFVQEITISELVSIDEIPDVRISMFPNPASEVVSVVSDNSVIQTGVIQVLNSLGQIVLSHPFEGPGQQLGERIEVGELVDGMYILRVLTDGTAIHQEKILIRH